MKTYSLAEALKSGKKFRAIGCQCWCSASDYSEEDTREWDKEDVLARYVLEEEPREWTVFVSQSGEHITNLYDSSHRHLGLEKIRVRELLDESN